MEPDFTAAPKAEVPGKYIYPREMEKWGTR